MPYTAQQPPATTVEWAQISKTAFSLPSIMPLNSKLISNSKDYYKTELAPIKWTAESPMQKGNEIKPTTFKVYPVWK